MAAKCRTVLQMLENKGFSRGLNTLHERYSTASDETAQPNIPCLHLLGGEGLSDSLSSCFCLHLGLTELCGEAGSGKTQIGLGLCVSCVSLSSSSSSVNIINNDVCTTMTTRKTIHNPYVFPRKQHAQKKRNETADVVIPRKRRHFRAMYVTLGDESGVKTQVSCRLDQMIRTRFPPGSTDGCANDLMKRILVKQIRNTEEFREFITSSLPNLLASSNIHNQKRGGGERYFESEIERIGVIVMDSISGLFRLWEDTDCIVHEDTNGTTSKNLYVNRSSELFYTASRLKWISDTFQVPIVLTNQVASSIATKRLKPALGLSWSNCINARYMLSRNEVIQHNEYNNCTSSMFKRHISVKLSSRYEGSTHEFWIDSTGAHIGLRKDKFNVMNKARY